ncbi:hypothetical protein D9M71_524080 [compost metagenome]
MQERRRLPRTGAGAGCRARLDGVQHDGPGGAHLPPAQRGLAHPRQRLGQHPRPPLAADRPCGKPDELRDQRRASADLPGAGMAGNLRALPRHRLAGAASRPRQLGWHPADSGHHLLGHPPAAQVDAAAAGAQPHPRAAPAQPGLAQLPGPPAEDRRSGQPQPADHRFRPPLRHLQARRAAVP